jgi:DNA-binding response OmpR family regulator
MHRIALRDEQFPEDEPGTAASAARAVDVLLVTGDANLRDVGERVLTREGYRVRVAQHSGHAVLAALTSRVDVLIAELSAPDISGPALAQLLRRHHPALLVVFMANPGTPEGLEHVVVRPFTGDDLLARLRESSGG